MKTLYEFTILININFVTYLNKTSDTNFKTYLQCRDLGIVQYKEKNYRCDHEFLNKRYFHAALSKYKNLYKKLQMLDGKVDSLTLKY